MQSTITRRRFLGSTALTSAGLSLNLRSAANAADGGDLKSKPALLGGKPAYTGKFPAWPIYDQTEEKALVETLHSGRWFRGSGQAVSHFEEAYARLTGAKHCLATSCGTSALSTTLGALEIGPGDEVILPPYTFV